VHKDSIETLRTWHRRVKVKTPPPKSKPIDYHVKYVSEPQIKQLIWYLFYNIVCNAIHE
jgi:hypothetical protein